MGPKRYARSVWFGITVFFAACVLRCYQLATTDPYPPGYKGVHCGMGALGALFVAMICVVLVLISFVVFVTRDR